MAYLFLATGAMLIFIAALPAFRVLLAGENIPPAGGDEGFTSRDGRDAMAGREEQLSGRLAALQAEVAALTNRLEELAAGSGEVVAGEGSPGGARVAFRSYLDAALAEDGGVRPPLPLSGKTAGTAAAGVADGTAEPGHNRELEDGQVLAGRAAATVIAGVPAPRAGRVTTTGVPGPAGGAAVTISSPAGRAGEMNIAIKAPAGMTGAGTVAPGLPGDPSRVDAPEPGRLSFQEQIRLAHAAGEGIDSLARRFGRGKGEIALILNLRS